MGGRRGKGARTHTPSRLIFFRFHKGFAKIGLNNWLAPLPLGLVPPGNPGSATAIVHRSTVAHFEVATRRTDFWRGPHSSYILS